jgi:DNA-binding transcriptional MerR regulator|tara:strand:- start:45 stop:560 length:516 start_codon:yes stop_codon:yes gene_type:complete
VKSIHAFKTISEVSSDLGVHQHILRFWEKRFPQIKPMTRAGGRRHYRPNDVKLLKTINKLLYVDSYTIKGVQKLFKDHGVSYVMSLYDGKDKDYITKTEIEKDEIKNDQVIFFKNDLFDEVSSSSEDSKVHENVNEIEKNILNIDNVNYKTGVVKAIKELKLIRDILASAS